MRLLWNIGYLTTIAKRKQQFLFDYGLTFTKITQNVVDLAT